MGIESDGISVRSSFVQAPGDVAPMKSEGGEDPAMDQITVEQLADGKWLVIDKNGRQQTVDYLHMVSIVQNNLKSDPVFVTKLKDGKWLVIDKQSDQKVDYSHMVSIVQGDLEPGQFYVGSLKDDNWLYVDKQSARICSFSEMVFRVQMHNMTIADSNFNKKLIEVQERNEWIKEIEEVLKAIQGWADEADNYNKSQQKKMKADSDVFVYFPLKKDKEIQNPFDKFIAEILGVTKDNVNPIPLKDAKGHPITISKEEVQKILFKEDDDDSTPLIEWDSNNYTTKKEAGASTWFPHKDKKDKHPGEI